MGIYPDFQAIFRVIFQLKIWWILTFSLILKEFHIRYYYLLPPFLLPSTSSSSSPSARLELRMLSSTLSLNNRNKVYSLTPGGSQDYSTYTLYQDRYPLVSNLRVLKIEKQKLRENCKSVRKTWSMFSTSSF